MGQWAIPSRFGATFRAGGGGMGGLGLWGGVGGQLEGAGGLRIYGLKWPPHRADHFEVQM